MLDSGPESSPGQYPISALLEIGRDEDGRPPIPGLLLVSDPRVSWRHCIITQTPEGPCFVRDVSRNGTRLDGRRLVPNVETEIRVGQTLDLGAGLRFVLHGDPTGELTGAPAIRRATEATPKRGLATVLFGDIRDYTVLVGKAPAAALQRSVSRVFEALSAAVAELGGTVKEFPGDAILAFWEGNDLGGMAVAACRAAIELDRLTRRLAADSSIWALPDFPLQMDWALATGEVMLDSFGGQTPIGLSLVGKPVVLACRIEKFATCQTGSILCCPATRDMMVRATREMAGSSDLDQGGAMEFVDLGPMQARGFDQPDHVFALRVPDDPFHRSP